MNAAGKRYIVHPSRSDWFRIWHLSDLHLMNVACAEGTLQRDINTIRDDPHSFFLGGGDYADFIGTKDKRFDPASLAPWVTARDLGDLGMVGMKKVRDLFAPIKHKCLGLLLGNHEHKYQNQNEHESLHGWLCEELGATNLGYSALFDIVFVRDPSVECPSLEMCIDTDGHTRKQFRVYCHHGAGAASTPGGKLNKLIQFMQSFSADLYFLGHTHDKVARKEPSLGANASCTEIVHHERLGMVAGSYLRTYHKGAITYGEIRGYRPTSLGAAVAYIHPETREMKAEV